MRHTHRRDNIQEPFLRLCDQLHLSYLDLSQVGNGCPDLLVYLRGKNELIELKTGKNATYTPAQIEFKKRWPGKIHTIRTMEAALDFLVGEKNFAFRLTVK